MLVFAQADFLTYLKVFRGTESPLSAMSSSNGISLNGSFTASKKLAYLQCRSAGVLKKLRARIQITDLEIKRCRVHVKL